MVTIIGNEYGNTSFNLDKVVCISLSFNTLEKGMNPFLLSSAMGK